MLWIVEIRISFLDEVGRPDDKLLLLLILFNQGGRGRVLEYFVSIFLINSLLGH
jgi:hypothetical protein